MLAVAAGILFVVAAILVAVSAATGHLWIILSLAGLACLAFHAAGFATGWITRPVRQQP